MAIARSPQDKWHSRVFGQSNTMGAVGLFSAVLLTSVFLVLCQPVRSPAQMRPEPGEAGGTLVAAVDEVRVNARGAMPGQGIAVNDAIETNASGRARLSFLSQTSVQIAGNTELTVARLATSNDRRVKAVILEFSRGVGRMVVDRGQRNEVAVIRGEGGGAVVILESGTLDAVVSGNRLVAVLRSGRATCRAANAQSIILRTGQSACVLTGGNVRPSLLSAAMDRVIDERLSFPPSSVAVSQTGAERALMDYAVNDLSPYPKANSNPDTDDTPLSDNDGGQLRLQRTAESEPRDDSLMQFIVRQLSQSSER